MPMPPSDQNQPPRSTGSLLWTTPQLRAYEVRTSGGTISEAAVAAGVEPCTIFLWERTPAWRARMNAHRAELARCLQVVHGESVKTALKTLSALAGDPALTPAQRMQAATEMLDHLGMSPDVWKARVEARLSNHPVEDQLKALETYCSSTEGWELPEA